MLCSPCLRSNKVMYTIDKRRFVNYQILWCHIWGLLSFSDGGSFEEEQTQQLLGISFLDTTDINY